MVPLPHDTCLLGDGIFKCHLMRSNILLKFISGMGDVVIETWMQGMIVVADAGLSYKCDYVKHPQHLSVTEASRKLMTRLEVFNKITADDNMENQRIIAITVACALGLCIFDLLLAPDEWPAGNLLGAGLAQTESLLHTLLHLYCKAQSKDRWPEFCTHLHAMDFIVQRSVAARSMSFLSSSLSLSLSISLALLLFHSRIHSLCHLLVLAPSNFSVRQFSH